MALQDLLNDNISTNPPRIIVSQVSEYIKDTSVAPRGNLFSPRKSLVEFYDLVRQAIDHYETREGTPTVNKINFTEEEPDSDSKTESIVFSLISRSPGQFAQGKPNTRDHVNYRPMFREAIEDTDYPTYNKTILGYYYDNNVRFTCWARTNKTANTRADWFEEVMENYSWWFKLQGVDRVLYLGRDTDIVTTVNNNKWYGRPIDFFVRTEKIRVFREKMLEEILISLHVDENAE